MSQLFVVGTDTGVGKTYVTCALARRLRAEKRLVGIYKPVCSGASQLPNGELVWEDVEAAWDALDGQFDRHLICPQTFRAPLAPNVAARAEGTRVDPGTLRAGYQRWRAVLDPIPGSVLLIEGAGGWLSPVTDGETVADLAQEWQAPVLVVAPQRLGTINHTLLTIESIRRRGLQVAGVILNGVDPIADSSARTNASQIETFAHVAMIAVLDHGDRDAEGLPGSGINLNALLDVHQA